MSTASILQPFIATNDYLRYGVAVSIREAYASGMIGKVFDCADNS